MDSEPHNIVAGKVLIFDYNMSRSLPGYLLRNMLHHVHVLTVHVCWSTSHTFKNLSMSHSCWWVFSAYADRCIINVTYTLLGVTDILANAQVLNIYQAIIVIIEVYVTVYITMVLSGEIGLGRGLGRSHNFLISYTGRWNIAYTCFKSNTFLRVFSLDRISWSPPSDKILLIMYMKSLEESMCVVY